MASELGRRAFLKLSALAAGALALPNPFHAANEQHNLAPSGHAWANGAYTIVITFTTSGDFSL